ncbi:MAG: DUF5672 family protein [Bacteroidia bacterium]|nr:DUF5672 family protein [Bacteroidia bacterium]
MKKFQVSIVIITDKNILTHYEEISLNRALEVFSAYNKYLVIPEKTDPRDFIDLKKITVIKLPEFHLMSINSYNSLLLSNFFYEHFIDSEYILIYQLDCFVFKNNLTDFLTFDYIGAPWFNTQNHEAKAIIRTLLFRRPLTSIILIISWFLRKKTTAVGNGGLSLRRVDKFIEITTDKRIKRIIAFWIKNKRPYEDIFFSFVVPIFFKNFKIADIDTATKFSFETYPRKCYALNNHELPIGCHAWAKHDIDFWMEIFRTLELQNPAEL